MIQQTSQLQGKNDTMKKGTRKRNRLIFSILTTLVSLAVILFLCLYDFEEDMDTKENRNSNHLRTVVGSHWRDDWEHMKNRAHNISIVWNTE